MKRIKIFLSLIFCLLILPLGVKAASGTISITSTSQVVLGNKVTVTVTLSSSTAIGSWEMKLNYDKKYLQLTSSTANNSGDYMVGYTDTSAGIKKKTYTFTFKTLKNGSTDVSIGSYDVYALDESEMKITTSKKTIKIITQSELEASYSKDNNLKNLSVDGYTITPAFNKDTLNYTVDVPEGTTSVKVNASANDSKASINGTGNIEVSEGTNNIKIVVRAENGSEKTYNLVVNVKDQNPINVNIDNNNYTVIKLKNNYTCPDTFIDSEITIDGINVPACYSENLGLTLVGLKASDGSVVNYIYNNGIYERYLEATGTSLKIIIKEYNGDLEGFVKTKAEINGEEYQVFNISDTSKTYVVYGINVETGEKNFYTYDTINKTFSIYDPEGLEDLKELNKTYLYVIYAFGGALLLSILCMLSLSSSKRKIIKKIKNMNKSNNVKEDKNKKEYNILEENKKSKK